MCKQSIKSRKFIYEFEIVDYQNKRVIVVEVSTLTCNSIIANQRYFTTNCKLCHIKRGEAVRSYAQTYEIKIPYTTRMHGRRPFVDSVLQVSANLCSAFFAL